MNKINKIFLLGGTISLAEAGIILKKRNFKYFIFTSKRQLQDKVLDDLTSLEGVLKKNNLDYKVVKNINTSSFFFNNFDENSLVLGFGEPWKLKKNFILKQKGRLFDFMCIPLPLFRGGAHYTWMSMMERTNSAVCIQEITKNTIQGKFDDGRILMRKNFKVNKNSKPEDFFRLEKKNAKILLEYFFNQIANGKKIKMKKVNEKGSIFFPRLFTSKNGWINWSWDGNDILKFINSFDNPYIGASTRYIKTNKINKQVYLKDASWFNKKLKFHPYQSGIIINKLKDSAIIATTDGALRVKNVLDNKQIDIKKNLELGKRLYSTLDDLENSMTFLPMFYDTYNK